MIFVIFNNNFNGVNRAVCLIFLLKVSNHWQN